jgi:hypothetical protein
MNYYIIFISSSRYLRKMVRDTVNHKRALTSWLQKETQNYLGNIYLFLEGRRN